MARNPEVDRERKIMPRIRYVKPEFFKDEDLKDLPFEARLFFAGMWCYADRDGRLEDRPERLKIEIFPYDKIDTEKMLELLSHPKKHSSKPYIIRYEIDGSKYIQIIEWHKHQKPHHTEKESEIPPLPKDFKGNGKGNGDGECPSHKLELPNRQITDKEPLKKLYLEFVKLTEEEYQKLIDKLGQKTTNEYIERLNNYLGSKGKKYKSHYHTILNWWTRDQKDGKREYL